MRLNASERLQVFIDQSKAGSEQRAGSRLRGVTNDTVKSSPFLVARGELFQSSPRAFCISSTDVFTHQGGCSEEK